MASLSGGNHITHSNQQSFWIWKKALEQRTGVRITPDREQALINLVNQRLKQLRYEDIKQYFADSLDDIKGAEEWSWLLDNLLVKETSFFRHQPSLDYVARWAAHVIKSPQSQQPLWIWSLGCSSGEEAYSLAITMREVMDQQQKPFKFGILATDISAEAISNARQGVYARRQLQSVSSTLREKYFDQIGPDSYRVNASLRSHICFITSNILEQKAPLAGCKMNLVYCQNLLVYFRRWQRREVVNQLVDHMPDEGHMVIGLGELGAWTPPQLTRTVPGSVQAYCKNTAANHLSPASPTAKQDIESAIRRC
jgi:type IV pilus assembly protein PilK